MPSARSAICKQRHLQAKQRRLQVKQRLLGMIPGLRVFLDVDNLSDISKLEAHVDASDDELLRSVDGESIAAYASRARPTAR